MDLDDRVVQGEIELEDDDAAIIFCVDARGDRIVIPDIDMNAQVPKNVLIATAIGLKALSDPAWVRNLCVEVLGPEAAQYFEGDDLGFGPQVMGRA